MVQHVRVDIGAVWPTDCAGDWINRDFSKSTQVAAQWLEDRPSQVFLEVDVPRGAVGEVKTDDKSIERRGSTYSDKRLHLPHLFSFLFQRLDCAQGGSLPSEVPIIHELVVMERCPFDNQGPNSTRNIAS
jgi:hypothetical protein